MLARNYQKTLLQNRQPSEANQVTVFETVWANVLADSLLSLTRLSSLQNPPPSADFARRPLFSDTAASPTPATSQSAPRDVGCPKPGFYNLAQIARPSYGSR